MIIFSQYKHGNELLAALHHAETPVSIENLMDKLQLSRRSIMYILENVNKELIIKQISPIENIKGIGYFLPPKAKTYLQPLDADIRQQALLVLPKQWSLNIKALTQKESLILFNYIIITQETTSINELMGIFHSSRNTVLKRLRSLVFYNRENELQIKTTPKGRIILGAELIQRKWVLENLEMILLLLKKSYQISYEKYIFRELRQYEQESGNHFTDDARRILEYFLTWYANRLSKGKILKKMDVDIAHPASRSLSWEKFFLQKRGFYHLTEYVYLSKILRIYACSKVNNKTLFYKKMHKIAEDMTDQFFLISGLLPGIHHHMMVDSLAVHLVSVCHRITAGLRYHNPLLEQIRVSYQNLFIISRAAAQPLTDYLGKQPSDDEIALLTTYFGSDIRTDQLKEDRKQILVVCSSGIGTSQFLLMQLREKYPHLLFSGPFRMSEYLRLSLHSIGLIITTTFLEQNTSKPIPVLQISALPTKYEWSLLNKKLLSLGFAVSEYKRESIQPLMDLIANYAKIEDATGLCNGLQEYFQKNRQEHWKIPASSKDEPSSLLKYITFIPFNLPNWKEAVRTAFRPLLRHNFIREHYVDRIIELTEKNGNYMLLGKGVLLAHAKPEDGVLSLSVSIALCKNPVSLSRGKHIKCIICLAPIDQTRHLDFLAVLLQYINDDNWCDRLYQIKTQAELESFLLDYF
ncbi:BglG family transcription antiterminator [Pectinatus haikarae]|uniref:BglG family transcription antiterminator n=1 Tax=Pectinatus haikarae TaxID=349096 RepID=UPI0018C4E1FC|nr:PTS sugar transporter subunit IIA [Pectinatus haikarae]